MKWITRYPIIFSQEVAYANDSDARDRDLAHVLDTARHVRARYWVSSSRDFNWLDGGDAVRAEIEELLTGSRFCSNPRPKRFASMTFRA